MPQWLIVLAWVSICAGVITALAVAADISRHPQKMKIMNVVWPVTGLYLPIATWFFYRRMGRPMSADAAPMKAEPPHWQRVFVSATHCGSGCVIGDVVAAPIVPLAALTLFGERLFAEYVVEFAFAYLVGIAFQYLPIREMRQVSRRAALADAIKADTISLIAFEIGMFLWMGFGYFLLLPATRPDAFNVVFWLIMQVGMVFGFLTTYPANWLLINWASSAGCRSRRSWLERPLSASTDALLPSRHETNSSRSQKQAAKERFALGMSRLSFGAPEIRVRCVRRFGPAAGHDCNHPGPPSEW